MLDNQSNCNCCKGEKVCQKVKLAPHPHPLTRGVVGAKVVVRPTITDDDAVKHVMKIGRNL